MGILELSVRKVRLDSLIVVRKQERAAVLPVAAEVSALVGLLAAAEVFTVQNPPAVVGLSAARSSG